MARSRPAPILRSPLGARFTVTRRSGHSNPDDNNAARTRSRALSPGWRKARNRRVGKAHDRERRNTARHMDFNRYRVAHHAKQRGGRDVGQHENTAFVAERDLEWAARALVAVTEIGVALRASAHQPNTQPASFWARPVRNHTITSVCRLFDGPYELLKSILQQRNGRF